MLRLAPGFLGAPVLLIPAGFADGFVQGTLWAAAIGTDLSVSLVGGVGRLPAPSGALAERFALIIIIALGESIVAIGVGASGLALGTGVVLAAVLGVALATSLWWAYFDLLMLVAERRLFAAKGEERARLARDAYPYLHLPMVAGIILVALGIKQTLAHVGDPLGTIPAVRCAGVALYLMGHNAFRLREVGSVGVRVGGDGFLLGAHLRRGVDPLSGHPGHPGASVCAGCFRDDAISGVPGRAPCAIEPST